MSFLTKLRNVTQDCALADTMQAQIAHSSHFLPEIQEHLLRFHPCLTFSFQVQDANAVRKQHSLTRSLTKQTPKVRIRKSSFFQGCKHENNDTRKSTSQQLSSY